MIHHHLCSIIIYIILHQLYQEEHLNLSRLWPMGRIQRSFNEFLEEYNWFVCHIVKTTKLTEIEYRHHVSKIGLPRQYFGLSRSHGSEHELIDLLVWTLHYPLQINWRVIVETFVIYSIDKYDDNVLWLLWLLCFVCVACLIAIRKWLIFELIFGKHNKTQTY